MHNSQILLMEILTNKLALVWKFGQMDKKLWTWWDVRGGDTENRVAETGSDVMKQSGFITGVSEI